MDNFVHYNPTRIVFGKGTIKKLKQFIPSGEKVLVLYGGGSIKKNGVYDQVKAALKDYQWGEFAGVQPNPTLEHALEVIEAIKANKYTFLLAVGGGSVIDECKFIAAAAYSELEPEQILRNPKILPFPKALPIGCILTLPATGSEANKTSVVSIARTNEKLDFHSEDVFPKFSILDPEVTYSLPTRQTINGVADAMVHVLEQYITYPNDNPLQDRQAEGILSTLIEEGRKVLKTPNDYAVRANIAWAAGNALNGLIGRGVPQDWATHMIGHELTAFYGLDHAQSLAVVLPAVWQHCFESKKAKLAQYARRVWNINANDDEQAAKQAITLTENYFIELGIKTRLSEYQVDAKEAAEKIQVRLKERGYAVGERRDVDADAAYEILMMRA